MIYAHVPRQTPQTNADKIRRMDDETLAAQMTQVFCGGVMALVDMEVPESIKDQVMADILEKLKQHVEDEQ